MSLIDKMKKAQAAKEAESEIVSENASIEEGKVESVSSEAEDVIEDVAEDVVEDAPAEDVAEDVVEDVVEDTPVEDVVEGEEDEEDEEGEEEPDPEPAPEKPASPEFKKGGRPQMPKLASGLSPEGEELVDSLPSGCPFARVQPLGGTLAFTSHMKYAGAKGRIALAHEDGSGWVYIARKEVMFSSSVPVRYGEECDEVLDLLK